MDGCDHRDLAAPYALGALDDAERERYEAHVAGCAVCTREVEAVRDSLLVLAHAGGEEAPPPELRSRVLAAVAREAALPEPSRRRRREPWWQRRLTLRLVPSLAMAAAAIVAIVLVTTRGSGTPGAVKALGRHSTIALRGPGGQRAGEVDVAVDGRAVAIASMPAAPAGKVYEAWVMIGGKASAAEPAGLFRGGGRQVLSLSHRAHPGDVVGVTLEPAGGSPAPTTAPLATANI